MTKETSESMAVAGAAPKTERREWHMPVFFVEPLSISRTHAGYASDIQPTQSSVT